MMENSRLKKKAKISRCKNLSITCLKYRIWKHSLDHHRLQSASSFEQNQGRVLRVQNKTKLKALESRMWLILLALSICRTGRPDHYRTSQWANEIVFFQRVFAEKPPPSCILFRIWLIWLDSFYYKWHSHYDGNGLAGLFWQMESTLSIDYG